MPGEGANLWNNAMPELPDLSSHVEPRKPRLPGEPVPDIRIAGSHAEIAIICATAVFRKSPGRIDAPGAAG